MPEIQTSAPLGEMTQHFIEFVMMQAQQAAMFLGRIPNPQTGKPEVNLDLAKLFIDQLEMIREKTRGNLSVEESKILTSVLSDLQMAFVQSSPGGPPQSPGATCCSADHDHEHHAHTHDEPAAKDPAPPSEDRKKFTKSYGA